MLRSKNKFTIVKVILIVLAVVLGGFLIYKGGRWLEARDQGAEIRGDSSQRFEFDNLIEVNNEKYRLRKNLTTALVMGIDKESEAIDSGAVRGGGQADFQRLLVFDRGNKKLLQIEIDRDTMADITIIDVMGEPSGNRKAQICLAHSFGSGGKDSCELSCDAVSGLFYDLPIDFYCAVNMDGIGEINDFVGGISVTLEDDFTSVDPSMEKGKTLTLNGKQAEHYVRSRMSVGVGTNEARMQRQKDYIDKLLKRADELQKADPDFIESFYEALEPYMITNVSKGLLINEVSATQDYERPEALAIPGTHQVAADGHMQFFPDEEGLKELVLETFYEKVS